jgi:hypothetical protein
MEGPPTSTEPPPPSENDELAVKRELEDARKEADLAEKLKNDIITWMKEEDHPPYICLNALLHAASSIAVGVGVGEGKFVAGCRMTYRIYNPKSRAESRGKSRKHRPGRGVRKGQHQKSKRQRRKTKRGRS